MNETVFLCVMYGSTAHGLAGPDSDIDIAEFYVQPTVDLLRVPVGSRPQSGHHTIGEDVDRRRTEVGAFLDGIIRSSHINDVEFLYAPWAPDHLLPWKGGSGFDPIQGQRLREVGRGLISALGVAKSTKGYLNTLLYGNHRFKPEKRKRTALRVAYAARELLETGVYPVEVPENGWGFTVRHSASLTDEQVNEKVELVIAQFDWLVEKSPLQRTDTRLEEANEWLMEVRKRYWS